jgi:arylsulfatase A-like enzyme
MDIHQQLISRWLAVLAGIFWGSLLLPSLAGGATPNIVLIVADDLGYPDLGIIGTKPILTPHVDRLAREGVRATSFYTTWYSCTPSRASMLTGRYPQRNGLYADLRNDMVDYGHRYTWQEYLVAPEMYVGLDPREITIGNVLRDAGRRTGVIGKWDMGQAKRFLPLQRGFDFFYGIGNNGIDYYTHERYGAPSMFSGNERTQADKGIYATDLFKREALRFIRADGSRPFFLYVAFNAPHSASNLEKTGVQAPEEYLRLYPRMNPKERLTAYYAAVTCMDAAIGEIVAAIDESGRGRDTLVVFTSDNGGGGNGGNEPLRGAKSSYWEGGIRVPFVARWPGRIPAGTVTDEFLTALELFPTFVAAAGAKPPPGVKLDGFDMLPVLEGRAKSPRTEMFYRCRGDWVARVGAWKLIRQADEPNGMKERARGLYHLTEDIAEQKDLTSERPDIVARLTQRFRAWEQEMEAAEPRGPFRDY